MTHPVLTRAALALYLENLDDWALTVFEELARATKSIVLALHLWEGDLDVPGAMEAARLEEDVQVEEWGFVQGGHDIEAADLRARLTAALVMRYLLLEWARDGEGGRMGGRGVGDV